MQLQKNTQALKIQRRGKPRKRKPQKVCRHVKVIDRLTGVIFLDDNFDSSVKYSTSVIFSVIFDTKQTIIDEY